jgi:hypothetical protein
MCVFGLVAEQKEVIVSSTILFAFFFLASICGGKLNHTPLGVDLQSWGLLQSFVSVLLFCFWHKIIKC